MPVLLGSLMVKSCFGWAQGLRTVGLSAVQTGMDNVRNMTGSPIAGVDPNEYIDVRQLNYGAPSLCGCLNRQAAHPCPR